MTTEDTGAARAAGTDEAAGTPEPNAFARELLAHDPTLPEVPELPGEVRDQGGPGGRYADEGQETDDEGERFDAG